MPRIYDVEDEMKSDGKSCGDIRDDYKDCVLQCMEKNNKSAKECVRDHLITEDCERIQYLLYQCKRSLLDNRVRFRGRKGYSDLKDD